MLIKLDWVTWQSVASLFSSHIHQGELSYPKSLLYLNTGLGNISKILGTTMEKSTSGWCSSIVTRGQSQACSYFQHFFITIISDRHKNQTWWWFNLFVAQLFLSKTCTYNQGRRVLESRNWYANCPPPWNFR